ncbi:hypothetical protein BC827DRAFT_922878 [Russula dissimulans]|nr:hypothetical protein BC827DRAFT_922878 [Russula dissimulans]
MVNFKDPVVISRDAFAAAKLWHTVDGLYIWEFIINLDYEWSVIRGHRPYRWTIWLYSFTRMATLAAMIANMVGLDTSRPIDCQFWLTFTVTTGYAAVATASLLIALRVIAIWNRNKIVYAIAMSAWVTNVACIMQAIVRLRSIWSPTARTCVVSNSTATRVNIIVTLATDTVMLLIMLVGLLRWRFREGGASGLGRFLWIQGLIWLLLATIGYLPATIFISLDLNAPFNLMFGASTVTTVSIAATRMYRTLTDYYNNRDITISSPIRSRRPASQTNRIRVVTAPIGFNSIDASGFRDIGQRRTPQTLASDSGTYDNTDGQLDDKPHGKYKVESGMGK